MSLIYSSSDCIAIRPASQRGIALLESILAMLIAGFMLLMLAQWMRTASDEMRAKQNADSLQQFTQMALQYLDVNRDAVVRVTSAATATDVTNATTEAATLCGVTGATAFNPRGVAGTGTATCAVDIPFLVSRNALPANYPTVNPYGQNWVAVYRLVYANYDNDTGTPVTQQGDIEVLVVARGGRAAPNEELGMTVQLMGGVAGVLPAAVPSTTTSSVAGCNLGQVCGPGGWQVNVGAFFLTY